MAEEKENEVKEYKLVEVTTETGLAISTPEGKVINQLDLLVEIANKLDKIEEAIA